MSSAKERHYQQLAAKLSTLSRELEETQENSVVLAKQLNAMNTLGAMQAAQFMAVTRLLDAELQQISMDVTGNQTQDETMDNDR